MMTREEALVQALRQLRALVEDGVLVRNTASDGDFNQYFKQASRLVTVLGHVEEVLGDDIVVPIAPCSHGVRRDLCPDCAPSDSLAADLHRYTGEVLPPRNHSHNAACYMLGQRQVSYRTCGRLEGEPE